MDLAILVGEEDLLCGNNYKLYYSLPTYAEKSIRRSGQIRLILQKNSEKLRGSSHFLHPSSFVKNLSLNNPSNSIVEIILFEFIRMHLFISKLIKIRFANFLLLHHTIDYLYFINKLQIRT